jgi:hypothetical protein
MYFLHTLCLHLISAGFTGAFVDREAETRGMDEFDKVKAKRAAQEQAEQGLRDDPNNNYQ